MVRLGVDVGGTFTDFILYDEQRDHLTVHKIPSTPQDPSRAVLAGLVETCKLAGISVGELDYFFHGTTIGTNTVLEGNGAKVGMITTKNFRDILHIGRHRKPYNFSLYQDIPQQVRPLVQRRYRLGVTERVAPDGTILTPLNDQELMAAVDELRASGVESIAVCLLFSFINDEHERRVKEMLAIALPGAFLSVSSEVVRQYREYERFSTTALNAYIGPRVANYLGNLDNALRETGAKVGVHLMQSSGGLASIESSMQTPVTLVLSGPVGGLLGGIDAARQSGFSNVITLDVGGTSADIGVAPAGEVKTKHLLDAVIGGYPVMTPMLDIETIGAGGGSIAFVDEGGALRVGPRSAGAVPGPAAYGLGGTQATVTDACVVLGRLRPGAFLGGSIRLDPERARQAIAENVAEPLGISVEQAAAGILVVMANNVANAIETNSTRKGYDPREFVLVAAGGAGPLFGADIAHLMEIPHVVVPRFPGITAAAGLLVTDVKYDFALTQWQGLEAGSSEQITSAFAKLETQAREKLRADGFTEADIQVQRYVDVRYVGQGYELRTPSPSGAVTDEWFTAVRSAFEDLHEREYFGRFPQSPIQIINLVVTGTGRLPSLAWPALTEGPVEPSADALIVEDDVFFGNPQEPVAVPTRFYDRDRLLAGNRVNGPAILLQKDSTTVVPPGAHAQVDRAGNLVIHFS